MDERSYDIRIKLHIITIIQVCIKKIIRAPDQNPTILSYLLNASSQCSNTYKNYGSINRMRSPQYFYTSNYSTVY